MSTGFELIDPPVLDLNREWRSFTLGDVKIILTWWYSPSEERTRPCMVLIPAFAPFHKLNPCVVTLDKCWVWSEEIGDPEQAALMAVQFGVRLGMPDQVSTAIRIRSLIVDHLQDLISMPPMPEELRQADILGEATVTETGTNRVVAEGEIVTQH
jgi:hypothetical protein